MATKAEIVKELADVYGVTASMKRSKGDLQIALEDAKIAAVAAEETAAETPPEDTAEFQIKQRGQITSISFGESGDTQTCVVTRYAPDKYTVERIFEAQSYDDVLVSLETWLKEERRRWR